MTPPLLAETNLAALYLLMLARPDKKMESFTEDQVRRARYRIYEWAKLGKLTKHGGSDWGQRRWDLREIESLANR